MLQLMFKSSMEALLCTPDGPGSLCEERSGMPCAGHSPFQPGPINPPQGTNEPVSQDGGALGKAYVRKGQMLPSRGGWGISVRSRAPSPEGREGMMRRRGGKGGKVLQVPGQRFTCSLWKTMVEQGGKPWRNCGHRGYMLEQIILKDCSL